MGFWWLWWLLMIDTWDEATLEERHDSTVAGITLATVIGNLLESSEAHICWDSEFHLIHPLQNLWKSNLWGSMFCWVHSHNYLILFVIGWNLQGGKRGQLQLRSYSFGFRRFWDVWTVHNGLEWSDFWHRPATQQPTPAVGSLRVLCISSPYTLAFNGRRHALTHLKCRQRPVQPCCAPTWVTIQSMCMVTFVAFFQDVQSTSFWRCRRCCCESAGGKWGQARLQNGMGWTPKVSSCCGLVTVCFLSISLQPQHTAMLTSVIVQFRGHLWDHHRSMQPERLASISHSARLPSWGSLDVIWLFLLVGHMAVGLQSILWYSMNALHPTHQHGCCDGTWAKHTWWSATSSVHLFSDTHVPGRDVSVWLWPAHSCRRLCVSLYLLQASSHSTLLHLETYMFQHYLWKSIPFWQLEVFQHGDSWCVRVHSEGTCES